ncbi:MAG: DsbA family protein [Capsulimonadaceae bacterium]
MNRSNDTIIIAHDYLCPWCWIGFVQARRLTEEFPQLKLEWRGYELLPESMGPLPEYKPRPFDPTAPPSRLETLSKLDAIPIPRNRTISIIRTHDALQGAEFAREQAPDRFDAYNEGVYRAFWERSEDISNHNVLGEIAEAAGLPREEFLSAVQTHAYSHRIVPFDEGAYADDVTHVPTFVFRGERCAEASYAVIREMAVRFIAWYVR